MRVAPESRYELLTCALRGHLLVGTDAIVVRADDHLVVREDGPTRWHRCLRCDGWFPLPRPAEPTRPTVPTRDEIELPLRGRRLRDRYVLRLIAVDRAIHVVVLVGLAIAVFFFANHRQEIRHDYLEIMNSLTGSSGGPDALGGFLGHFRHLFVVQPAHLYEVAVVLLLYAALEATEMVGLWQGQRWAEYLTFVATLVLVPLEVYELAQSVSWFKLLTFIINVAIALYLLWAKRLFGIRGGHEALERRRDEHSGWEALERATPDLGAP